MAIHALLNQKDYFILFLRLDLGVVSLKSLLTSSSSIEFYCNMDHMEEYLNIYVIFFFISLIPCEKWLLLSFHFSEVSQGLIYRCSAEVLEIQMKGIQKANITEMNINSLDYPYFLKIWLSLSSLCLTIYLCFSQKLGISFNASLSLTFHIQSSIIFVRSRIHLSLSSLILPESKPPPSLTRTTKKTIIT